MPKHTITAGQLEAALTLKNYNVPIGVIAKVTGASASAIGWYLRGKNKSNPPADLREIVAALRSAANRLEAIARMENGNPDRGQRVSQEPGSVKPPSVVPYVGSGAAAGQDFARFKSLKASGR